MNGSAALPVPPASANANPPAPGAVVGAAAVPAAPAALPGGNPAAGQTPPGPATPPAAPTPVPATPQPVPVPAEPPGKPGAANEVPTTPITRTSAQEGAGTVGAGNASLPAVGAKPNTTSPAVRVPDAAPPSVGATSQVLVTDVKKHLCQADETYESLSERNYGSSKYAQALKRFNREYYQAPDVLRPGVEVQIPVTARELEARYPDAIPGYQPPPPPSVRGSQSSPVTPTGAAPVPVVAVTPTVTPTPVPSVAVPAPGTANPPPARGAAPSGKVYRVAPGGEPLWTIARNQLGNGNRWHEIYRLNPRLNPEQPVPEGTVLTLPDSGPARP
jgi:nucleoid-associated protein YgaU